MTGDEPPKAKRKRGGRRIRNRGETAFDGTFMDALGRAVGKENLREYKEGELVPEDTTSKVSLYFPVSGRFSVTYADGTSRQIGPGEVLSRGAIHAAFQGRATVRAHEQCASLVLDSEAFNSLIQDHPDLAMEVIHRLEVLLASMHGV